MIRLVRILGILLIVVGALILLAYLIEPLRMLWPLLLSLAWPIRVGLAAAAVGLLVLFGSVLWERMEEHQHEREIDDGL